MLFLLLVLLSNQLLAQKILKKTISTSVEQIEIEFNVIDQLELITTDTEGQIVVYSNSEDILSSNINIISHPDKVYIKNEDNALYEKSLELDKLCSVQPIYASYKIEIPKNKIINVTFTGGNFYSNNFKGNLQLKVEEGIVSINSFEGSVFIHINMGNVMLNDLNDVKIDAKSNLGKVTSNYTFKTETNNQITGKIGNGKNSLKIKGILANINLRTNLK